MENKEPIVGNPRDETGVKYQAKGLDEMNQAFMRDHEFIKQMRVNKWLVRVVVLLVLVIGVQFYMFFQKADELRNEQETFPFFEKNLSRPDTSFQAWDPFEHFQNMQKQMDQFFARGFPDFDSSFPNIKSFSFGGSLSQKFDLKDQGDRYVVTLNLPGLDQKNVSINVEDQSLKVSGTVERKEEVKEDQSAMQRKHTQHFERYLTFPGPVKAETLAIEFEDDLLKITVEKEVT